MIPQGKSWSNISIKLHIEKKTSQMVWPRYGTTGRQQTTEHIQIRLVGKEGEAVRVKCEQRK